MWATGALERQKKICLVFAVGPESDGNRGSQLLQGPEPEGTGAPGKGLQRGPRGPRKGSRKKEAQEKA
jgi:hypothetical protein